MYNLLILRQAQKDLDEIKGDLFTRLRDAIGSLTSEPRPHGCLKLTGEEGYRLRVGDYRILYRIDDQEKRIYIYRIKHRREAYR